MVNRIGKITIAVMIVVIIAFILLFSFQNVDINSVNSCSSDSDCIIVSSGCCGGAGAINKQNGILWSIHLIRENCAGTSCIIPEPLSSFVAKCQNSRCVAIQIKETTVPYRQYASIQRYNFSSSLLYIRNTGQFPINKKDISLFVDKSERQCNWSFETLQAGEIGNCHLSLNCTASLMIKTLGGTDMVPVNCMAN